MNPQDLQLIAELRRDEGVRYVPYLDTVGIETVGVGHNMKAKPLPDHWTFPLTDNQVDLLLSADLINVFSQLDAHLGWWRTLSYARMRVIANMCFNLGINGLLTFKIMLSALERAHYSDAAQGMEHSKWAQQVGARASRLASMMRTG